MKEKIITTDKLPILAEISNSDGKPTAKQMKDFAARFTKKQWDELCFNVKFVNCISENLDEASLLAENILGKK